jgi:two-component system, response regulator / RNA-binding antiterminator
VPLSPEHPAERMEQPARIAIVDDSPMRSAILEEGLREAGYTHIVRIGATTQLLARLAAIEPDVIVIGLENPSRDVLEQMFQVSRVVRRPVAMFVDQSDAAMIEAAIEAGVSAYVVDGLKKERVKSILETSIMRFRAFARLKDELDDAKSQLEDRKTIDKAKAILMRLKGVPEEEAYRLMRRTAMNENRKIAEVARALITAAEILQ